MFGGADDNATAPVADHQDAAAQQQGGMLDSLAAPAAEPVAAPAYEAGTFADTDVDAAAAATPVADDSQLAADTIVTAAGNDLISIKQRALQQLSPLVGHLEQTPEEKFRTTMMLIQASDNADLIKEAYEAAQQIPDEKVRAQALLDVVNEINYFTQHAEQQQ